MPTEKFGGQILEAGSLGEVKKFGELFDLMNMQKFGKEYQDAYDEVVNIAKHLVDSITKKLWQAAAFEDDIANRYPTLSREFVSALCRCVENYNPPVNLSDELLW